MEMNQDTLNILYTQFADPFVFWMLVIFLTPMIAGAVTTYYCLKANDPVTKQVWKEWREDPEFQKQKVTSSINYNE